MKKFIFALGLVAMMLNLTNCAQNEEFVPAVDVKGDFEIYASATRTANDGLNTVWSAGDDLAVFHAVTDVKTYTNDGQFTIEDTATGRFLGKLNGTLDVEEEYDWFAMYPYSDKVSTPAATTSGYMTVGAKAGVAQAQNGNDSMAHLAGVNYPLAGVAKAVGAASAPTIEMKNLTSVLEFEVTNSLDDAITVQQISFTAPENITGTYYINFVDMENVVFIGSGDNYVSKIATLTVNNGTAIAKGESAKFYLAIKPFTATAGSTLSVSVAATVGSDSGAHTKDLALSSDVTFSAGKIKTVKVDYNTPIKSAEDIEWVNNAYNLVPSTGALSIGDKVIFVSAKYNKAMGAQGGNNRPGIDVVKNSENNTVTFDTKTSIFTVASGSVANSFAFKTTEGKYIYAASSSSNHLKEEATLSANSSWDVNIINGIATVKAKGTNTRNWLRYNDAATNGNMFSCYNSGQTDVCIYKLVGEYTPADPVIEFTVNDASIAYDATSGSATISTTYATNWTITATSDQTWIKNLVCNDAKTAITFESEANEGEERSATITVTASREGYDAVVKTFKINQAAKPTGGVTAGTSWSYTFTAKQWTANGAKTLNKLSWTLAGDGSYWGYDGTKGQQFGSSNNPYKSLTLSTSDYEGGVNKIVINTSGASGTGATFIVTVGGKQIGTKQSLTSSNKAYTLTSAELLVGDIVISYTQTTKKAIYIKSIAIN